jgi:PIN domain nuclease of toxin-antitoxin system
MNAKAKKSRLEKLATVRINRDVVSKVQQYKNEFGISICTFIEIAINEKFENLKYKSK